MHFQANPNWLILLHGRRKKKKKPTPTSASAITSHFRSALCRRESEKSRGGGCRLFRLHFEKQIFWALEAQCLHLSTNLNSYMPGANHEKYLRLTLHRSLLALKNANSIKRSIVKVRERSPWVLRVDKFAIEQVYFYSQHLASDGSCRIILLRSREAITRIP